MKNEFKFGIGSLTLFKSKLFCFIMHFYNLNLIYLSLYLLLVKMNKRILRYSNKYCWMSDEDNSFSVYS